MTIAELKANAEYKYDHTGSRHGYESRKGEGRIEEYHGRFGDGYIHVRPRWDTSKYVYIDYYIKAD